MKTEKVIYSPKSDLEVNSVKGIALSRITSVLENIQATIGGFFLFVLLIVVFTDVVSRQIGMPIVWLQNIAGFAFIWVVFFGAAIGLKKGTHYKIELFPKAGIKFRKFMDLTVFTCEAIFIIVLITYGYQFAVLSVQRLVMPSGIPLSYTVISIPISGVFMLCYLVEIIINWIAKK